MKLDDLKLRCYAEPEKDGSWFAACIDLNLVAQGDSFQEVRGKLHSMIDDYIREAVTVDRDYVDDLIPRRAPLYFWVRYYFIALIVFFRKLFNSAKECVLPKRFTEVLPLVPA